MHDTAHIQAVEDRFYKKPPQAFRACGGFLTEGITAGTVFGLIRILDQNLEYQLGLLAQYCVIVTCHTQSMAALLCLVLRQYPCAADSIFLSRIRIKDKSHFFLTKNSLIHGLQFVADDRDKLHVG